MALFTGAAPEWLNEEVEVSIATYQAYQILYYAFIALFVIAGLDKFVHLLADWDTLIAPKMVSFFHLSTGAITMFAGLIELGVAAAVALKPRYGTWAVTIWLGLITINLLILNGHSGLILQNLTLGAASVAFTRLSAECN